MSNHFPSAVVSELIYLIDEPGLAGGLASLQAGEPLYLVSFQFASDADWAAFDQDATEVTVATAVTALATMWSAQTGADLATVQASVTVSRQWTFAAPGFVTNNSSFNYTDAMTYPPAA
jgi:hypothetical protein